MFDMKSLTPLVDIPGHLSRRPTVRLVVAPLAALVVLLIFAHTALAHEQWIVTPEQILE
jgi:hypothetical protein